MFNDFLSPVPLANGPGFFVLNHTICTITHFLRLNFFIEEPIVYKNIPDFLMKRNCWQVMNCGREPGGINAEKQGLCKAATNEKADGLNEGKNGGRACWVISGTFCTEKTEGTFAIKLESCLQCEFYRLVSVEEGLDFLPTKALLNILKSES